MLDLLGQLVVHPGAHGVDALARLLDHQVGQVVDLELVVPRPTRQRVRTSAAVQRVVARQSLEAVGTGIALQPVGGVIAAGIQGVSAQQHQMFDMLWKRHRHHAGDGIGALPGTLEHLVARMVHPIPVIAWAPLHLVHARTTVELVIAAATQQRVVGTAAPELVVTRLAVEVVRAVEPAVRGIGPAQVTAQHIRAIATVQAVGAAATQQAIGTGPTVEVVVAMPLAGKHLQRIVAAQVVIAFATQQRVALPAAEQQVVAPFAVEQVGPMDLPRKAGAALVAPQRIQARAAAQRVIATATDQGVVAGAAVQNVIAPGRGSDIGREHGDVHRRRVAPHHVGASIAVQQVIAAAPLQVVVALVAVQAIRAMNTQWHEKRPIGRPAGVAKQLVVARASVQQVSGATAIHRVVAGPGVHMVRAVLCRQGAVQIPDQHDAVRADGVGAVVARDDVGASHAVEVVLASTTEHVVIARAGDRMVVAVARVDAVAVQAITSAQGAVPDGQSIALVDHAPGGATAQHGLARRRQPTVGGAELLQLARQAARGQQEVVAGATIELVLTGATGDEVVALPALQFIVARATIQRVVARQALQLVGAITAEQHVVDDVQAAAGRQIALPVGAKRLAARGHHHDALPQDGFGAGAQLVLLVTDQCLADGTAVLQLQGPRIGCRHLAVCRCEARAQRHRGAHGQLALL